MLHLVSKQFLSLTKSIVYRVSVLLRIICQVCVACGIHDSPTDDVQLVV